MIYKKTKKIREINQQGTSIKENTSETTRYVDFVLAKNKKFLNWFIGYIDGSESCFIVNRRYLRFELNVNVKYDYIILYIKQNLGFGTIRKLRFLDTIILEFSVQDNIQDLLKLIYIINGNLRCPYKEKQFKTFYNKLEVKLRKMEKVYLLPPYNENLKDISLKNAWFLGYCENKQLLYARWHKSKKLAQGRELYINCIFWHLNEKLLVKIKELLKTKTNIDSKTKYNLPFFKLVIEDINEKIIIKNYFTKYKFKNKRKEKIFEIWKKLLDIEEDCFKKGLPQPIEKIDKNLNEIKIFFLEDEALYKV